MGSYAGIVEIATSASLQERVTAAAAAEGIDNPSVWVTEHMWKLAATPGWSDDWDYATDAYQVNQNPDTGARTDVINDQKILAAVQALNAPAAP